jgi:hypothetical protein
MVTTDDGDDDGDAIPSYDDAIQAVLTVTPAQCHDPIRQFFSRGLYDCIFMAAMDDSNTISGFSANLDSFELGSGSFDLTNADLDSLCENVCCGRYVDAFGSFLTDAPDVCLGTITGSLGSGSGLDLEAFAAFKPLLQLYCAEGGVGRCGEIANTIEMVINAVESNQPIDLNAAACTTLTQYGKCLGNYVAYGNLMEDGLGDMFASNVTMVCSEQNVDVSASVSGTEAAATLGSSASSTLASFFAIILALALALLF